MAHIVSKVANAIQAQLLLGIDRSAMLGFQNSAWTSQTELGLRKILPNRYNEVVKVLWCENRSLSVPGRQSFAFVELVPPLARALSTYRRLTVD
jgi:hypothetical protein